MPDKTRGLNGMERRARLFRLARIVRAAVAGQPRGEFILLAAITAVIEAASDKYTASYRTQEHDREKVYEFSAARIEAHGTVHILVSHEDVTELRDAAVAIRELSRHVAEIEEDEGQRIAGELHDATGQHLIAICLNLMNVRRGTGGRGRIERLIEEIERSTEERSGKSGC